MNFVDDGISSCLGKDVLRLFQASLGIAILDVKMPKATHLGYLAHAQRVIRGDNDSGENGRFRMGDSIPIEATSRTTSVIALPAPIGGWTLTFPDEDDEFFMTASNCLLSMMALLAGCGDAGVDWTEDAVLEFVRYVDCDTVRRGYLSPCHLRRLDGVDLLELLQLFGSTTTVSCEDHALNILVSIGSVAEVSLVRGEAATEFSSPSIVPRSVLASATKRGLPPISLGGAAPVCWVCPDVDPATEDGWVERQMVRGDYRSWDTQRLRDWCVAHVNPPHVGASKHVVLAQIGAWLSGQSGDGRRRPSPSESELPYPPIGFHTTRQFCDDVCSRVFSLSTLQRLPLYVLQAEMTTLCPSFVCTSDNKDVFVQAMLDAYPVRAFGEAKRNSWPFL